MKIKTTQIVIVIFSFAIFSFSQSNSWNGLTPLYSTRVDVEKLLGKPKNRYSSCDDYEVRKERIFICYSSKECEDGWNVAKDVILKITVHNSDAEKRFDDLKLEESKFSYTVDDAFYNTWTNAEEGLQYYFDGSRLLQSARFIPKASNNNLRCNGFPSYAPEGQHFTMETFLFYNPSLNKKEHLYSIFSRLDSFTIELKNINKNDKYKGYALIYFDNKLPFEEYEKRLSKIKDHIYKTRKISPNEIMVIEGGLREESQVELYLLPKEWKPPAPNPTLPSPQFMKKQ